MSGELRRMQVLLEEEQHQRLYEVANKQERSLSSLLREIVREYLDSEHAEAERDRSLEALETLAELRRDVGSRVGVYDGDLVAEVREERERERDRVLRGEG